MEYQEFLLYTKECVADFMGDNFQITINHVAKNNGVVLDGLVIMEKGQNISPTIYMDPFYEAYADGREIADIVKEIVGIYEKHVPDSNMDIRFFKDYDTVRGKIVCRVINYDKNTELLKEVPHRRFLDLAVVCHCLVVSEMTGSASILIRNSHLKMWGIAEDTLFAGADENTGRLLRAEIMDMKSLMQDIIRSDVRRLMKNYEMDRAHGYGKEECLIEEFSSFLAETMGESRKDEMYVLTNHLRMNGAACIRYPGVLKEFAEKTGTNLYILPSSVHEVLLVPERECTDPSELNRIVMDVNKNEVDEQEVLSDSVYYYNRHTDEIKKID